MVKYVVARQISGKKVITNEGEDFGRVIDLSIDEISGRISYLYVDPNPDNPMIEKLQKEDNYSLIPFDAVLAIGDYVIIDKRHLFE